MVKGKHDSLRDADARVEEVNFLEVPHQNLCRGKILEHHGTVLKQLEAICFRVDANGRRQSPHGADVLWRGCREVEVHRVRENARYQEPGHRLRHVHSVLRTQLSNNRARAPDRLVVEVDGAERGDVADTVMIDDLEDIGLLHAIDSLQCLIVVHENNLFARKPDEVGTGHYVHRMMQCIKNHGTTGGRVEHRLLCSLQRICHTKQGAVSYTHLTM